MTRWPYTIVCGVFQQVRDRGETRVSSVLPSTREGLTEVPLFAGCSRRELARIARIGTPLTLADGTRLATQGRRGLEFVLLISGRARLLIDGETIDEIGPGDQVGGLSILSSSPALASVVADGEVQVRVYNCREFYELIDLASPIAWRLLVRLASERHPRVALALTA
jgi:CRP/FNR family cyclic AMP-dependent transcriptional regulator